MRDDRTGLFNGLELFRRYHAASSGRDRVTLWLMDVDGLHGINRRSHEAGDLAIAAAADALRDSAVAGIDPYRLGGDEFALLSAEAGPPGPGALDPEAVADRLQRAFRHASDARGVPSTCTVAYAVAQAPFRPGTMLWRLAATVRAAKAGGGSRRVAPPPAHDEGALSMSDRLLRAVVDSLEHMEVTRSLAYTDAVTGLPNHRSASAALAGHLASHTPDDDGPAIVFVDGDGLRRYNHAFGYEAGNDMIRRLGGLIAELAGPECHTSRWLSGDEFLVVLPRATAGAALDAAARLCAGVRERAGDWPIPVTVSAGVAACPRDGRTEAGLLGAAYAACARAKEVGGDRAEASGHAPMAAT